MKVISPERTGVLIVRLWVEENHETGLRVRITQTLDASGTEQSIAVVAHVDDICDVVKQWVDAFVDHGSRDGNGEATLDSDVDGS